MGQQSQAEKKAQSALKEYFEPRWWAYP